MKEKLRNWTIIILVIVALGWIHPALLLLLLAWLLIPEQEDSEN